MLTTLTLVKSYLGVTDNADDTLLNTLIASIDAKAKAIMNGRVIEEAEYEQVFDGSGTDELLLPQYPITEVAAVYVDADRVFYEGTELTEDEDFTVDADSGILRHETCWTKGRKNVKVSWSAGYETVPADLEEAARMAVADTYTRAKQLASGQAQNELASENIGGEQSQSYRAEATDCGVPQMSEAVFKRYRTPS